jgi:ribonuclease HI
MVNGTKYCTIATDASTSDKYQVSTWACYIRSPRGVIKHAARFAEHSTNTAWLETKALANALVIADNNMDLSEHKIIIYNEIAHVLTPLKTKKAGLPRLKDAERTRIIVEVMLPILEKAISWELRDVKAHSKAYKKANAPKKFILNRWCDLNCRRVLREQVSAERRARNKAVA